MLNISILASGSSGNCALVSDGITHIVIDAGISARRITTSIKSMGIDPADLDAILITHEHSDHIAGLAVLQKQLKFQVYATEPTARQLCCRMAGLEERLNTFWPGEGFQLGSLWVGTFPTLHDCACPTGYTVSDESGSKLAVCTDLGLVTPEVREGVRGAQLVVAEANYDTQCLCSGPYPASLKERILGDYGHLSNEMGGELALYAVEHGAWQVVLGHLSQENNSPDMAYNTVKRILTMGGIRVGTDMELCVAPRQGCGGWMKV